MSEDSDDAPGFASPPCFLHELCPDYLVPAVSMGETIARWRKSERARLVEARLHMSAEARQAAGDRIAQNLDRWLGDVAARVIAIYWPIRGEPDLRQWLDSATRRGARCALPVVVKPASPLQFRTWRQGEPLARGIWNIPAPEGGDIVTPDVVIAPVIGFDRNGYRLGYGGCFFDRTLAALSPRPTSIGVGYATAFIPTIYPQSHDIEMDAIATDEGVTIRGVTIRGVTITESGPA